MHTLQTECTVGILDADVANKIIIKKPHPNQNPQNSNTPTKNPNPLSPIQTKTGSLQNPPLWNHHIDKEREGINERTHHHDATRKIK